MRKTVTLLLLHIITYNIFTIEFNLLESDGFNFYTTSGNNEIINNIKDFNLELNSTLKFDPSNTPRNIYILDNKEVYNQYLNELGVEPRNDFAYVTYNRPENNRLIIYSGYNNQRKSLYYHLTLQYIDNTQSKTPDWYKKGLASYFEDNGEFNSLKKGNKFWSAFYYLFNTENTNDKRVLWDSLSYIRWNETSFDINDIESLFNENSILAKGVKFTDEYVSYEDKVENSINLYNKKQYNDAKTILDKLIIENETDHTTYYYLGLCLSSLKEYNKAYSMFSKAIDLGAPADLTYYSIAVNFYNSGNDKNALKYLGQIEEKSEVYLKSQELVKTINR